MDRTINLTELDVLGNTSMRSLVRENKIVVEGTSQRNPWSIKILSLASIIPRKMG
jgi:hypothetical protein